MPSAQGDNQPLDRRLSTLGEDIAAVQQQLDELEPGDASRSLLRSAVRLDRRLRQLSSKIRALQKISPDSPAPTQEAIREAVAFLDRSSVQKPFFRAFMTAYHSGEAVREDGYMHCSALGSHPLGHFPQERCAKLAEAGLLIRTEARNDAAYRPTQLAERSYEQLAQR